MNKRQVKKAINSRRFAKVLVEGTRFYSAKVVGRTVLVYERDDEGREYVAATADIAEVTATFTAATGPIGLRKSGVGSGITRYNRLGHRV